jgi:Transmembrane secretion effector
VAVWRHRRFRLFWTGDTVSAAGGALSTVAVPLLALRTLHATDTQVGALRAAQTLPFLLLAVPIGLLADRISRRRLLLAADALRFPLVGVIALAGAALGIHLVIGLVFVAGVGAVAYEVGYLSVLPALVEGPAELPAANRAVETAHATAGLVGPAAGGALVSALTPAGVVALDAVSFGFGAVLTALNRWERAGSAPETVAAGAPRRSRASLIAGWKWLWRDRLVRPMTLYLAVNNLAAQAFSTVLLVFLVGELHGSATAVGLALAASGAGFLAGAAVSPAAARRLGTGVVIVGASLLGAVGIAVVAAGSYLSVLAGSVLAGAGPGLLNLQSIALRQAATPGALLGRVNAAVKTVSYGSGTLGARLGGVAASASGPRTAIVAAAIVSAAATAFPAFSAVRKLA